MDKTTDTIRKNDIPKEKRYQMEMTIVEQLDHGRLVSNLAYLVGKELGMEKEPLRDLVIAGYFHDIGKTEIEFVTTSAGDEALLVEEMNSIRQHPKKGYEILKRHGYSEIICDAVLHHHENYDGSGYPDNLEGWNISLEACILRVCDIFCALTSDRPYRSAFSPEQAMEMMIEDIQKYDIKVFLAFQRVIHGEHGGIILPEIQDEVRGVWKEVWN
ncbi:MAG: HD domain-containing protein [Eubacterium sp.]|nr:HD domain-containing protein [Eubacterium sp.]